jgi:hypothetical protein
VAACQVVAAMQAVQVSKNLRLAKAGGVMVASVALGNRETVGMTVASREALGGVEKTVTVQLPARLPVEDREAVAQPVGVGPLAKGEAAEGEAVARKGVEVPLPLPPQQPPGAGEVREPIAAALMVVEP